MTGEIMKVRITGTVLPGLVEERMAIKARHPYLLTTTGGKAVSERMLTDRWAAAREAAAVKAEAAGNRRLAKAIRETFLYYMRKRAAQKEPTLQAARLRLQHDTEKLTRDHYRPGADAMDPVI